MPHWTDFVAGGEQIYEDLASTGTTTPAQTTYYMKKEKGFVSMRVLLQSTVAAERSAGAVKCISDNAAAGSGYEGMTASRWVTGESNGGDFAGVLTKTLLNSDAADEWEVAQLQIYGYFKDAYCDGAVVANDLLTPSTANVDDFDELATAYSLVERSVGVALENDSATTVHSTADVFLFGP